MTITIKVIIYLHTITCIKCSIRTYSDTGEECYAAEDAAVHHPHRKCVLMSPPPESVCLHFAGSKAHII